MAMVEEDDGWRRREGWIEHDRVADYIEMRGHMIDKGRWHWGAMGMVIKFG